MIPSKTYTIRLNECLLDASEGEGDMYNSVKRMEKICDKNYSRKTINNSTWRAETFKGPEKHLDSNLKVARKKKNIYPNLQFSTL